MNLIEIENRTGRLSLNDAVTPSSINRVIEEMERLYGTKAVTENRMIGDIVCSADQALEIVDIHIHSGGGSVLDGHRLFHAIGEMRSRGVKVLATINTLAASMGSVIAMAADEVRIVSGGRMMIHEASQDVRGTAEDHARAAKLLEEISAEIAGIYAAKTGKGIGEMRDLMKKETWMGAAEAVAMGFADEVVKPAPVDTKGKATSENDMGLFNKSDSAAAVIALEAENAELREQFTSLQATAAESAERVVSLRNEITGLSNELDVANKALEAKDAEIESAKNDLAAANAAVAGFDDKVEAAAQAKFAGLGGDPLASSEKEASENATMTRAAFDALDHPARDAFFKNGGKLKD